MRAARADGGEIARWGVGLPVCVRSPALDRAAAAQAAGVRAGRADGGVAPRWGAGLPVAVVSPALDRAAAATNCAGVRTSDADGAVDGGRGRRLWRWLGGRGRRGGAARRVGLPVVVVPPALDRACAAQAAGVIAACADGAERACWGAGLPALVSPARDRAVLADCAGVGCRRAARTDGAVAPRWGVGPPGIRHTVPSPTLDRAARADCAGMKAAGADGAVAARWGAGLPVTVASPALDRAAAAQAAGVLVTGADGGKAAAERVGLPVVVASPALDRAARADRAGLEWAGADGGKAAAGRVGLPVVVAPPALDRAALADCAGVASPCAEGGKAARWGIGLPTGVQSPTLDRAAAADRAVVRFPYADGAVAGGCGRRGRRLWRRLGGRVQFVSALRVRSVVHLAIVWAGRERDLAALQPAAYPRVGREVAHVGIDALDLVGRRECELGSAVVQAARFDVADRASCAGDAAAAQPLVYRRVGGEKARAGQDSVGVVAAAGQPAELDPAAAQLARDDLPADLLVAGGVKHHPPALRAGGAGEVDDNDDPGGRGQRGGRWRRGKSFIPPPPPARTFVLA